MGNILLQAVCLISIIFLGYFLKQVHLLSASDFQPISRIVFYFTLPCAIVNSLRSAQVEPSYLLILLLGLGGNLLTLAIGYFLKRGQSQTERAFAMINLSGYNIGNFAYPFIQAFLGPNAMMALCLFDTGNCIMCTSGTKVLTGNMVSAQKQVNPAMLFLRLFASAPFDVYLVMFFLTLMHWHLPQPVFTFTGIVGGANTFLSMLMLGLGFAFSFQKSYRTQLVYYLGIRLAVSAALGACFFFLLPFPHEVRKALVLLAFSPVSTWSPLYSQLAGGDVAISSAITSFSILLSVLIMTLLLLLL